MTAAIQWSDAAPLPIATAGGYAAVVRNKIVYAGGTNWRDGIKRWLKDVQIYDPQSNRWSAGPALPTSLSYGACTVTAHGMEIFGGSDGESSQNHRLRLDDNLAAWMSAGVVPFHALFSQAAAVGRDVYLFGGSADPVDLTRSSGAVMMSNVKGDWTPVSVMPHGPVLIGSSAAIGGDVYLFGGCLMQSGKVMNSDDACCFHTGTRKWTQLRALPHAMRASAAIALDDGNILIAGGYSDDDGFTAETLIYNVSENSYRPAAPLPSPVAGVAIVKIDDRIFLIGGEDRMKSRTDRVLIGKVKYS